VKQNYKTSIFEAGKMDEKAPPAPIAQQPGMKFNYSDL
jgi:hypothetical protein